MQVAPRGIVRLSIKLGAVPTISSATSVSGSPVVTVPIANVGVNPSSPVGPVTPVGPVGPTTPTKFILGS